jgi:putative membrane protein
MRAATTLRTILLILCLATLVGMALSGWLMATGAGGMMGSGMMGRFGAPWWTPTGGSVWGLGMVLGMLTMVAFWAALICAVVLVVRWMFRDSPPTTDPPDSDQALAILRRRYAAGEIDRSAFEQMRQELQR